MNKYRRTIVTLDDTQTKKDYMLLYRYNQKDDFLAISVIQTCIDVVPDFYHLPKTLQKNGETSTWD